MKCRDIHFHWEIRKIISELSLLPILIWSSVYNDLSRTVLFYKSGPFCIGDFLTGKTNTILIQLSPLQKLVSKQGVTIGLRKQTALALHRQMWTWLLVYSFMHFLCSNCLANHRQTLTSWAQLFKTTLVSSLEDIVFKCITGKNTAVYLFVPEISTVQQLLFFSA